jgi:hypothetical protein
MEVERRGWTSFARVIANWETRRSINFRSRFAVARRQGNGWDEPYKPRGLRTVLWAAGGEIPPADPARCASSRGCASRARRKERSFAAFVSVRALSSPVGVLSRRCAEEIKRVAAAGRVAEAELQRAADLALATLDGCQSLGFRQRLLAADRIELY